MQILLAPDKFKGSLNAKEVCAAIQSGLLQCDASLSIVNLPLADGGEGTCALLTEFTGGEMVSVRVHDPLFRQIESGYGISKDGTTAFIEMAKASGLQLLKTEERNPLRTSTLGTGELIRHAFDRGVTKIILGIGGSATNDAGIGIAEALGVRFFSSTKRRLEPIGESLEHIHTIDVDNLHPRCKEVSGVILCDVDNSLHGPRGAAFVFAPQKGADAQAVKVLDEGLRHFGALLQETFQVDVNFPGAGAAGGISVMLKALMPVDVQSGVGFIAAFTDLEKSIIQADVVITGEGKMDEQTLSGKVVFGVAGLCKKYRKPIVAFTGKCDLDSSQLKHLGISHIISLTNKSTTGQQAMEKAAELLKKRAIEEVFPLLSGFKN